LASGNADGDADGYHLRFPLQVQHLKITMVTGFLPMGNGNAYDQLGILVPAAGPAAPGTMVNMLGFSPMHNADGYQLRFLLQTQLLVYSYASWFGFSNGEWRM